MIDPRRPTKHDRTAIRVIRGDGLPDVEVHHGRKVRDAFEPHFHAEAHVTYVLGGARIQTVGRRRYTVGPEHLLVIPPGEVHSGASSEGDGWSFAAIYCSPAAIDRARDDLAHDPARGRWGIGTHVGNDPQSGRLVVELAAALSETPLAAQTHWLMLMSRLLHRGATPPTTRRERTVVKKVRAFLDAHLTEAVSLDQLVELTGVSKEHLVRSFTADFGLPPHAYQINARVERAKQMLLHGATISDVALALGFHDQSHFTRHFKRIVGVPPGHFAGARRGA